MNSIVEPQISWSPDQMIEITLNEPDDFLKVRETLTRIGVASRKEKKLYQSCHILHKQGRYYIVHFKELFALDGKRANITVNDVQRRNRIIQLLLDWGLVSVVSTDKVNDIAPLNQIKVSLTRKRMIGILKPNIILVKEKNQRRSKMEDENLLREVVGDDKNDKKRVANLNEEDNNNEEVLLS